MVRTGHHFNVAPTWHDAEHVIGLSDSAIALWVLAGSYCVDHITDPGPTDGRISPARAQRLRPDSWENAAKELVAAGIWKKLPGRNSGWQFTDWRTEQQTKKERETYLRAEVARKRRTRKAAESNENPRSTDETSARTPARTSTRNAAGTSERSPSGVPALRSKKKEVDRDKDIEVDGHLRAQEETRAREPVDNSRSAGWRAARCTDHQSADAAGECPGCVAAAARFDAVTSAQRRAAQNAERRAAAAACGRCDDDGLIGSRACTHREPGGRQRAEQRLAAAQQAAPGIVDSPGGADAPGSDDGKPSAPVDVAGDGSRLVAEAEPDLEAEPCRDARHDTNTTPETPTLETPRPEIGSAPEPATEPTPEQAAVVHDDDAPPAPDDLDVGMPAWNTPISPAVRRYIEPPARDTRTEAALTSLLITPQRNTG